MDDKTTETHEDEVRRLTALIERAIDKRDEWAERAVACKHWRWMQGMVAKNTMVVVEVKNGYPIFRAFDGKEYFDIGLHELPNLTDPATLGCLLALVREAWSDNTISVVRERGAGWVICTSLCDSMLFDNRYFRGFTEAEALVAALEVAP